MAAASDVTELLVRWSDGDRAVGDDLYRMVEPELRGLAERLLRREAAGPDLQVTALVDDVFVRVVDQKAARVKDRAHFFALAARMARHELVDEARRRLAAKRGGRHRRVELSDTILDSPHPNEEFLVVAEMLDRLRDLSQRQYECFLYFYQAWRIEDIAREVGVSIRTVKNELRAARTWLALWMSESRGLEGGTTGRSQERG